MTARGRIHLNPSDYIIQVWTNGRSGHASYFPTQISQNINYLINLRKNVGLTTGMSSEVKDLLSEKYRLIFSNLDSTYLDHGFGTWLGRDHLWQIKTWQVS